MVQDQLVEYIGSELKSGVSAETLKATLVGAGWQAADVDDTMKKVQSPQGSPAAAMSGSAQPAQQQPKAASSSFSVGSFGGSAQKLEPQVIRVSDLVSAPGKPAAAVAQTAQPVQPMQTAQKMGAAKTDAVMARIATSGSAGSNMTMAAAGPKKSHAIEVETLLGILMIAFGVVAAFFFFENRSLSGQISSLNATGGGVSSQLSTLQSQLDASTTALAAQVSSATAANTALALDLSFYAVPSGTVATTTFTTALEGTVSLVGKTSYVITTPYGAKVVVANSKDANVIALLKSLVGNLTPVQFAGNYVPGVASITLTAVNGVSTTPPPVVPTSTPSSSAGTGAAPMIPATSTTP
ncbi:MAG: hypothetical protein P4L67_03145 [Candidatus Pacebacteria bacterium]|nr:hypothetical protein [Candidatus Paceibacterota bacterium]